jgi:fluoride exporter
LIRNFLLVALGGAIGSVSRYSILLLLGIRPFPLATLLINILGSFVIGLVIAMSLKSEPFANNWRPFLATGLCGGFTTFSAFSLENLQLLQTGKYFLCAFYIFASLLFGILAAWLGYKLIISN